MHICINMFYYSNRLIEIYLVSEIREEIREMWSLRRIIYTYKLH